MVVLTSSGGWINTGRVVAIPAPRRCAPDDGIVLPSRLVKSVFPFVVIVGLALASCSMDEGEEQRLAWSEVQAKRAAYQSAPASERLAAKQRWADAVREYLRRWPEHPAAVRTWNALQLDFAEQLEANGHFAEAERHYSDLLQRVPHQPRAAKGLERVRRRQTLSRDDFQKLSEGMTTSEVAEFFGLPRPGWDKIAHRDGERIESWYYRDAAGTIRGVHFREGILFEIDPD